MTERQEPTFDRRLTPVESPQPVGHKPLMVKVPLPDDRFIVPGGNELSWREIERTRPITPLSWWRDRPEMLGAIPNAFDWCKDKGYIIAGEPSGWCAVVMHNGVAVARMTHTNVARTLSVHFDGWNDLDDEDDAHTDTEPGTDPTTS